VHLKTTEVAKSKWEKKWNRFFIYISQRWIHAWL